MTRLPFLVVHGAIVWKVLLAVLVAASCLVVRRWRWWKVALAALASWSLVLYELGRLATAEVDAPVSEIAPFGRLAIAAALPGSRAEALGRLRWLADGQVTHDEQGFQLALAIDRFRGVCESERLLRAVRLDEALTAARRCGTASERAVLLIALGRYEDAAAGVDPAETSDVATVAYMGIGRWRDAARANGDEEPSRAAEESHASRCFSALLSAWGGDAAALERLTREPSDLCKVMAAVGRGENPSGSYDDVTADVLAETLDPLTTRWKYSSLEESSAQPWLAALEPDATEPLHREHQRQMRARRLLQLGRFDATAQALAPPAGETDAFDQRLLQVALAIRANRPLPPRRPGQTGFHDAEVLRAGSLPEGHMLLGAFPESCPLQAAIGVALDGNGGPLVEVFRTCSVFWSMGWPWLPAILPRVTHHRDELAAVVRQYRNDLPLEHRLSPFEMLADFALYRDTARLAGDDEDANRWQAIIDRHATMLSDRRRVVAFAIWSSFH